MVQTANFSRFIVDSNGWRKQAMPLGLVSAQLGSCLCASPVAGMAASAAVACFMMLVGRRAQSELMWRRRRGRHFRRLPQARRVMTTSEATGYMQRGSLQV